MTRQRSDYDESMRIARWASTAPVTPFWLSPLLLLVSIVVGVELGFVWGAAAMVAVFAAQRIWRSRRRGRAAPERMKAGAVSVDRDIRG